MFENTTIATMNPGDRENLGLKQDDIKDAIMKAHEEIKKMKVEPKYFAMKISEAGVQLVGLSGVIAEALFEPRKPFGLDEPFKEFWNNPEEDKAWRNL